MRAKPSGEQSGFLVHNMDHHKDFLLMRITPQGSGTTVQLLANEYKTLLNAKLILQSLGDHCPTAGNAKLAVDAVLERVDGRRYTCRQKPKV